MAVPEGVRRPVRRAPTAVHRGAPDPRPRVAPGQHHARPSWRPRGSRSGEPHAREGGWQRSDADASSVRAHRVAPGRGERRNVFWIGHPVISSAAPRARPPTWCTTTPADPLGSICHGGREQGLVTRGTKWDGLQAEACSLATAVRGDQQAATRSQRVASPRTPCIFTAEDTARARILPSFSLIARPVPAAGAWCGRILTTACGIRTTDTLALVLALRQRLQCEHEQLCARTPRRSAAHVDDLPHRNFSERGTKMSRQISCEALPASSHAPCPTEMAVSSIWPQCAPSSTCVRALARV
jgi:hypothetical protein